jgi:phosphate starvation-inducible protein PhoH
MAISKRQKRTLRKNGMLDPNMPLPQKGMNLTTINPKTENQKLTFEAYDENQHLILHGSPGTGKTFLSMYLALYDIFKYENNTYENITIIRSATPTKDMGYLPGKEAEKLAIYTAPYRSICTELFNRGDAYDILKHKGVIDFQSTSYLRGTTLDNSIVILDEAQNLSYMELKTVLTRIGQNSRIIICGDILQDDLTSTRYNQESGLTKALRVFEDIPSMTHIEFGIDDIVRSGFVKEFIVAESNLYDRKSILNVVGLAAA